jgi:hypothetical protein
MRPKGKLLALLVMFAAVAGLTATGAFTTVEAERTAEINATGDASALLGLEPQGSAISSTSGGELLLQLNGSGNANDNQDAEGVNQNATTDFGQVLKITNNGQDTVDVKIEVSSDGVASSSALFYVDEGNLSSSPDSSTQLDSTLANSGSVSGIFDADKKYTITEDTSGPGTTHVAVTLDAGDSVSVGLMINLKEQNIAPSDEIISSVSIQADEDLSSEADYVVTD